MTDDAPRDLHLDLPAAHSAGRMGRQVVRKFALEHGIPEEEIDTLELVASELLSNAVDHGGGGAALNEADLESDVRMQVCFTIFPDRWELRVADQGGGDPEDVASYLDDQSLPDLEDERGRGFFLLVQMVDEVTVQHSEDGRGLEFFARKSTVPAD